MSDVEDVVKRIENYEVQGAHQITIECLKALRGIAQENGVGKEFNEAAERLENVRETGVSTHNCIKWIRNKGEAGAIDDVLDYLERARDRAAGYASNLVKDGSIILTHSYSSTVVSAFRKAREAGKEFKVIVTETEPKLEGLRTARELVGMDIPVYYIVDSAAGLFMWAADYVLVGAGAVKPPGIMNKTGTYLISLAAKEDPDSELCVVTTRDKFDHDNFSDIEAGEPDEIRDHKKLEDPDAMLNNPTCDLTPWSNVDDLITEDGILQKHEVMDLLDERFDTDFD